MIGRLLCLLGFHQWTWTHGRIYRFCGRPHCFAEKREWDL